MSKLKNVSTGTLIRTLCLLLALANQLLAAMGKSPLPISSEELTQIVSCAITAIAALVAWWENNSFTKAAIAADSVLHGLQCPGVEGACATVGKK